MSNESEAQFLGWAVMMFQEHDGALADYCAKRLDLIAMYVDSMSEDA